MKQILFTLLLILCCLPSKALNTTQGDSPKKERNITLWGHIRDSFTKVGIRGVKITLMTEDSTVVDTCTAWRNGYQSNDFCYNFKIPAHAQKYIIRATHPDYYDTYVSYHVKSVGRNRYFDAPWHYMKRRNATSFEGGDLDEVVVKATRIKVAYRGDTIVYDASAFKLPDGSMLDALVRQLPGAQLSDDGTITVNGRKVDYLTLNGKDFFKGKNKMMLDNLPYFTVSNIKVYDRSTDFSKYMGKDVEKKEYVMDVNLKKEYSTGYLANLEAGVASSDRYMGRVFSSMFSNHTRIATFANINNINETRNPDGNGNWRATDAPEGKTTNRSAGLNIQSDGTDTWYKNAFDVEAVWNDYANNRSSQKTMFMPAGNSYDISDSHQNSRKRKIEFTNNFTLQLPVWLYSYTNFILNDADTWSSNRSASLNAETSRYGEAPSALDSVFAAQQPKGIQESLVNRTLNKTYYKTDQLYAYQAFIFNSKLPWGDNLELEVNGYYGKNKTKNYMDYRLDYNNTAQPKDYRNLFVDQPSKRYKWEGRAEYYINALNNWTWRIYTLFRQEYSDQTADYYNLHQLDGWGNGMRPLGDIPSTVDSLLMVRSFDYTTYGGILKRRWQSGFHFYYQRETDSTTVWLRFHLPLYVYKEKFTYQHAATDTCATQSKVYFNGNVDFRYTWNRRKRVLSMNLTHETKLPGLDRMIPFDDSNPLSVVIANSNLKTGHRWVGTMRYQHTLKNNRMTWSINPEYAYETNPLINGYRYNRETGGYTYQVQNADYRWSANLGLGMSGSIDKKQLFSFSIFTKVSLEGNQVMELPSGNESSQLYGLHKFYNITRGDIAYRKGDFSTGINGNFEFYNTHYQQNIREDYHGMNSSLTYSINYTIPVLRLNVGSTYAWYHVESSLQYAPTQNYNVWNCFMARSFLKGNKLTVKLIAYDLLDSVKNYTYIYSANSFSANTRETLGRYVMLSMAYRINVNPKKR